MKPWIFGLLLVLLVAVWGSQHGEGEQYREMNDFGMNKPHLLFQLGQRKRVTTSFGFGYWQHNKNGTRKSKQSNFSSLRLTYENKKNGLYVDMLSHDGDSHIH